MTPRIRDLLACLPDDQCGRMVRRVIAETLERWIRTVEECHLSPQSHEMVTSAIHEAVELQLCSIIAPLVEDDEHTNPEERS